jgi:hypothetical protein
LAEISAISWGASYSGDVGRVDRRWASGCLESVLCGALMEPVKKKRWSRGPYPSGAEMGSAGTVVRGRGTDAAPGRGLCVGSRPVGERHHYIAMELGLWKSTGSYAKASDGGRW